MIGPANNINTKVLVTLIVIVDIFFGQGREYDLRVLK